MAASGFTPVSLYYSVTTTNTPLAANLVNGELAINIVDGKLFYKDNSGVVQVIATKGAGTIGGSNTQVQFNNSGVLGGSANFTWNGSTVAITGALTATADSAFTSTGALQLPSGTLAQQPTGVAGKIRFNTSTPGFEGYNGTKWGAIGGAQANGAVYENTQIISSNYTMTTGYSGESVGPITINSGVTVTIPSGSRWVVL
jgi:hypothetical protein